MTERGSRRRRPSPAAVVFASLAAFMAVLAFLAFQVRAGHDPALGRGTQLVQVQQRPRRVVVRRVEDDYVITRVVPAPVSSAGPAQPSLTTSPSGGSASSGGTTTSVAPVAAVPPAAPVAPPSPAPATRAS